MRGRGRRCGSPLELRKSLLERYLVLLRRFDATASSPIFSSDSSDSASAVMDDHPTPIEVGKSSSSPHGCARIAYAHHGHRCALLPHAEWDPLAGLDGGHGVDTQTLIPGSGQLGKTGL